MKLIKLFGLSIILVACTSAAPKRNFNVQLYKTDAVCVRFLSEDGAIVIICDDDDRFPEDLIGITVEDYNKERDYQDLLINQCKKWKR